MSRLPGKGEVELTEPPETLSTVTVNDDEWFTATTHGLIYWKNVEVPIEGEKGKTKTVSVSKRLTPERFEVRGRLKPIDGHNDARLLVRIGDHEVTVQKAAVATESDIARWLADHDVRYDSRCEKLIKLYFAYSDANTVKAYTQNGWQKDAAFVVGETVIHGDGASTITEPKLEQRGTYEEWREHVLPLCDWKPGCRFGILVILSTPLLLRVDAASGSLFNLSWLTSSGKTIALKFAAGLWGKPSGEGTLKSFRTTLNGIEGLAHQSSDLGLVLDEMKLADISVVVDGVYLLSNGFGKERAKPNGKLRERVYWRTNALVSSEKTIESIVKAAKKHQSGGEVIRSFDISIESFFPKIPLEDVQRMERAVMQYYGTAGIEFVRRLMHIHDIPQRADAALRSLYDGDDSRLQRAARAFSLLIVAGEIMGIETDVVHQAFQSLLATGYKEALDDFRQVAERILGFLYSNMNATIMPLTEEEDDELNKTGEEGSTSRERNGWYRNDTVYLLKEPFERLLDGQDKNRFNKWAGEKGIIYPRSDGPRGWTNEVPIKKVRATKISLARLREAVEESE